MKSTGIVRKLDDLGRIVIPMELRRIFGIAPDDAIEIFVQDDKIVLQKYEEQCTFCNSEDNLTEYKGKQVCGDCLKELSESKP